MGNVIHFSFLSRKKFNTGIEDVKNFWRVKPDLLRTATEVWGGLVAELSEKFLESDISKMVN